MRRHARRLLCVALLLSSLASAEIRELTILHTNDLHAHLSPLENGSGGFAYLAATIARERAHCNDCILLNAGDLVQGSPVSTIFHGLPVFGLANLLGFDAATLGNHEFDYGWQQARTFIDTAVYPIVTANLDAPDGQLFTPHPYVILRVNGLRVAVIGGMTESLVTLTTPKTLGDCRVLPLVETVRKEAAEARTKSDIVVLLAHITGDEERAVLNSVCDISVIVSGHIHSGLAEALSHDGRVLVRVKSYGEELGRLELKVDTEKKAPVSWTWKHIPVSSTIAPEEAMARGVAYWESEVAARVDKPLAISERQYNPHEVKRLMEQAIRDETGADFAFMNQGGVRDGLPKGQLLERNVWNIMPFDNDVVVGKFKGRDLPPVVVGDRKIDPNREYTLAVSDYTAANQGTRENFGATTGLKFPDDRGLMRNLLIDWFRRKRVIGD